MYCENCGAELTGGGKFCPECGTPVKIKVQNQYQSELETGGQAFAYLPEEEPLKTDYNFEKAGHNFERAGYGFEQAVPDYGYSDDTIRAAEDELARPSAAEEYKKTSTDWRDHVDTDRFREQNAQTIDQSSQGYADQSFYNQPDQFMRGQQHTINDFNAYGMRYSDRNYIFAALLAFFFGAFGAHNFYLGYRKKALIQLALTLFSFLTLGMSGAVAGIWAFVEFILILIGTISTDGDGNPLKR